MCTVLPKSNKARLELEVGKQKHGPCSYALRRQQGKTIAKARKAAASKHMSAHAAASECEHPRGRYFAAVALAMFGSGISKSATASWRMSLARRVRLVDGVAGAAAAPAGVIGTGGAAPTSAASLFAASSFSAAICVAKLAASSFSRSSSSSSAAAAANAAPLPPSPSRVSD